MVQDVVRGDGGAVAAEEGLLEQLPLRRLREDAQASGEGGGQPVAVERDEIVERPAHADRVIRQVVATRGLIRGGVHRWVLPLAA